MEAVGLRLQLPKRFPLAYNSLLTTHHAEFRRVPGVTRPGVQRAVEAGDAVPRAVEVVGHQVDKVNQAENKPVIRSLSV